MGAMHYYKRNLGDYAKKAGRLSMLQHGAYTLLLDACYDREQFPTFEEAIDWTWASSSVEIEAVEFVLRKFFFLEDGVYVQKRVREALTEYRQQAETNKRIATERETKRREKSTTRAPLVNEAPPNQKPLTINQEQLTKNQKPRINNPPPDGVPYELTPTNKEILQPASPPATKKAKAVVSDEMREVCREVWKAYSGAYFSRYGAEPVRNQKINRNVVDFCKRIAMHEAPHIAAWYVSHSDSYYVRQMHSFGMLLRDAEKIRTEWATGHTMTQTKAKQVDRAGNTLSIVNEIMSQRRAKE